MPREEKPLLSEIFCTHPHASGTADMPREGGTESRAMAQDMAGHLHGLRVSFAPYVRAVYPAGGGGEDTLFVSMAGVRVWAAEQGLAPRQAMAELLTYGIWPECFRREFGVRTAAELRCLLLRRVLVLGCGGLGGAVAEALARAGVGAVRLVDADVFEESNLNRQRFCTESVLGRPKAQVVGQALRDIAPHMEVEERVLLATPENVSALLDGIDAALDCLDNIPMKISLEQAALTAGVPFVHGAVLREEGFVFVNCGPRPRLTALYPQGGQRTADDAGASVSGFAPAIAATMMAGLCVKTLLGMERGVEAARLNTKLLHWDAALPELEAFDWQ